MSALSLAQVKGWESRRLLEHVSAPRSAGVPDLQLLLLRAILTLASSAVCGSQLQAKAPEQQREEELHRSSSSQGWALPACQQHKLRSAAASPQLPPALLKSATRFFGCSEEEREVREVQTY